ncbi:MAG: ABC transporter permease [Cytophagales bacterium]|nr:ABC transporter permease [Cytophagales bacterium]
MHSLLNVFGLALGLAAFMLIVLWTNHELSYDGFHHRKGEIYRVYNKSTNEDGSTYMQQTTPAPLGLAAQNYFPQVDGFVRTEKRWDTFLSYGETEIKTSAGLSGDRNFFEVFALELLEGRPSEVLNDKHSIVLSESTARKLFPQGSAVGKVVRMQYKEEYKVTGVMKDPPSNSTFHKAEFVYPFYKPVDSDDWNNWNYATYFLIRNPESVTDIEDRTIDFILKAKHKEDDKDLRYLYEKAQYRGFLQPIEEDRFTNTGKTRLYLFLLIGLFILILAVINFINLSTAQSALRAKEVGLRKVHGGEPKSLRRQFLAESVLTAGLSGLLSLVFVELARPFFSSLVGISIDLYIASSAWFWMFFAAAVLMVGLVSGTYPSFYLSRLSAVHTLSGGGRGSGKGRHELQQILVVLQFAVAIGLMLSTAVVFSQLNYMNTVSLGYSKENCVHVMFQNSEERSQYETVKAELEKIPGVLSAAGVHAKPYTIGMSQNYKVAKDMGTNDGAFYPICWIADPDFLQTYDLQLAAGRSFNKKLGTDKSTCVINEALARKFGWSNEEAVGQKVYRYEKYDGEFTVIGVLKDFNFAPLSQGVAPLVVTQVAQWSNAYFYLALKIDGKRMEETLGQVEKSWRNLFSDSAFDLTFVEEDLGKRHVYNQMLFKLFSAASGLAVVIALLGLFSLSAFKAQRKVKEMGVRKVYGAELIDILKIMTDEFTRLILIASVVAVPVAYKGLSLWLDSYAFHVDFNYWFIPAAIGLGLLSSWLTVLYHSMKVARQDPVEALRYE